ncbi:hypothetical protein ACMSYX_003570, partial [Cronobacter dublinensis]
EPLSDAEGFLLFSVPDNSISPAFSPAHNPQLCVRCAISLSPFRSLFYYRETFSPYAGMLDIHAIPGYCWLSGCLNV